MKDFKDDSQERKLYYIYLNADKTEESLFYSLLGVLVCKNSNYFFVTKDTLNMDSTDHWFIINDEKISSFN